MSRLAFPVLALALTACAAPPPDRRLSGGEPDWGAIARRIGR